MHRNKTGNSIVKGTLLTVSIRWMDRFVGLVSTFVLARLLTPEDFGIVAIASLAVNLANIFLSLGVNVSLIKIKDTNQDHFDTAWTIRFIQCLVTTIVLFLLSQPIALYFHDQRSVAVLYALAFLPLLTSFENIGIVEFHKGMHFNSEFRFLVLRRLIGFFITIFFAWYLHSYWALVIGSLATVAVGVLLSYILHPMRPKFSLSKWKEIFSISQWMFFKSTGDYLQQNLQNFFVARWEVSSVLGAFSMASAISVMPTEELLAPFNRVLFPAFSKCQSDHNELKKLFLLAQGLQALIAMPAAVGLAMVAREVVPLTLGPEWLGAIPFIQVLALVSVFEALTKSCDCVMLVLGSIRTNVFVLFFQIIVFFVLAVLFYAHKTAFEISLLRLYVSFVGMIMTFILFLRIFSIVSFFDVLNNSFRPVIGALFMAFVLFMIENSIHYSSLSMLVIKVFFGAIAYISVVLLLWIVFKMPIGAESYVIARISNIFRR